MKAKAKTIKMLLYDGGIDGVMNISDSAWAIGNMYSAPRESINDLVSKADCRKYGVYLLLSDNCVYVGQASDLERRTKQHLSDKDWWTQIVLMTTIDDSFNSSDIDYLESRLIDAALSTGRLDNDNKRKGNPRKVSEFRRVELEQYLEEAFFLLELIGIKVFKAKKTNGSKKIRTPNNLADNLPALPDPSLGPCPFARTALINLLKSGYEFSDEQMLQFGSVEGSREYTTRNLPLFWILKENETRESCDKAVKDRYWKDEFVSGKYRFLMYSQWYSSPKQGATKEHFIKWYESL